MVWTLGMTMHLSDLHSRCDGKKGMDYVQAKLHELNYAMCWCKDPKWAMVNRHIWRIGAMYRGEDCFLAGFSGTRPHDRLWSLGRPMGAYFLPYRKAFMSNDMLIEESRNLHNRRHYLVS